MHLKKNCSFDHKKKDDTLLLRLYGEIDHHSAMRIRMEMDALIKETVPKTVYMDLSGIEFMDSSGLGLIMGRHSLMDKLGGKLVIQNPNDRIARILDLAGISRMIEIKTDKEDETR